MPPAARDALGGYCYHVLNRGNGRRSVFHKEADFAAFVKLLRQAGERLDVRLLAYCLLPNHFHLLLSPRADGDLSASMMWLTTRTCAATTTISTRAGTCGKAAFAPSPSRKTSTC
jgi:putative transposase